MGTKGNDVFVRKFSYKAYVKKEFSQFKRTIFSLFDYVFPLIPHFYSDAFI